MKHSPERRLLGFWLTSAALVAVSRILHAISMSYDLGLQILAGQNLLKGNGLSIFEQTSADLNAPASLMTLTHFPAGYSV